MATAADRLMIEGQTIALESGRGTATRSFRVRDDAGDEITEADILTYVTTTWPIGTPLPTVPGLLLARQVVRPLDMSQDGTFTWVVELEYRDQGLGLFAVLPWNRPPRFSMSGSETEVPFFLDATSPTPKKSINTVGDLLDPLPTVLTIESTFRYIRNENPSSARAQSVFSLAIASSGRTAFVNSDSFLLKGQLIPAQRAVMWIADLANEYEGSIEYWRATYGFKFYPRASAVDLKIVNAGYFSGTPSDPKPILFGGQPTVVPALLNAAGDVLPPSSPPHELSFKVPLTLTTFAQFQFT